MESKPEPQPPAKAVTSNAENFEKAPPEEDYLFKGFAQKIQVDRDREGLPPLHNMSQKEQDIHWVLRMEDEPWERELMGLPQKLYDEPMRTTKELEELRESLKKRERMLNSKSGTGADIAAGEAYPDQYDSRSSL